MQTRGKRSLWQCLATVWERTVVTAVFSSNEFCYAYKVKSRDSCICMAVTQMLIASLRRDAIAFALP